MKIEKAELINRVDEFTINCNKNFLISNIYNLDNGKFMYSDKIEDSFWNFICNINVNSKEEFEEVWNKNRKYMIDKNRIPALYITPGSNLIHEYKKILPEYMKIESEEIWMIYDDFDNLLPYKNNTYLDIEITSNADLKEFTEVFMNSYGIVSEEDPYGEMPEYYRDVIINYNNKNDEYNKTFYLVKFQNKNISCAITIVKDDIALICFVGTIKEYRNKGLCKNLINKILNDLKSKDIKYAYLQTEEGFIPEKLYSSLNFKIFCKAIIAVE